MNESSTTSTRPYLIRAIHEWCTDNGLTPYLSVRVNRSVQVPREFVNDGEIVLNVSYDATGGLQLGNEYIEFQARFGGKPRDIMIPVERVQAIYARDSGQGMSFPVADDLLVDASDDVAALASPVVSEEADAPQAAATEAPARVVHLVPTQDKNPESDGDEPRPPTSGGTARPALKRIK